MKKIIALAFFIALTQFQLNAQGSASTKIFHGIGSYFSLYSLPTENSFSEEISYDYGFYYKFRYNLVDLGDNLSISTETNPSLGLDWVSGDGFFGIESPTYLSLNFGAGSTYDSDANLGLGLSAGYNLHFLPITGDRELYGALSAQVSIRYWSKVSLVEYFLRIEQFTKENSDGSSSGVFSIGVCKFLGY